MRLIDGGQLAFKIRSAQLLFSDVSRILYDLEGLAAGVENRIVARLDPNFATTLRNALILTGVILSTAKLIPEGAIFSARPIGRFTEHGMVLTLQLLHGIAECTEEVTIGVQNFAISGELNHRLRLIDGGQLAFVISVLQLLCCDVGGVFHHLHRLAIAIKDRIIAGFNPDLTTALADALILPSIKLTTPQFVPEGAVFSALAISRFAED